MGYICVLESFNFHCFRSFISMGEECQSEVSVLPQRCISL